MKISIITPTLNQAKYIENTILSVVDQNYNNFEHIIVDGGSTDGTLEILMKYPHLKWISEKDSGQSNAINKGFRLATGEIIAWINSDDFYEKNIFNKVNDYFDRNPDCNFLYGDITYIDKDGKIISKLTGPVINYENLLSNPDIVRQPSSFWRATVLENLGFIDEKLHLIMDYEFILRIAKKYKLHYTNDNLSYFRFYEDGKTSKFMKKQLAEIINVLFKKKKLFRIGILRFIIKRILSLYFVK